VSVFLMPSGWALRLSARASRPASYLRLQVLSPRPNGPARLQNIPSQGPRDTARLRHAFPDPTLRRNLRLLGHRSVLPDRKMYSSAELTQLPSPILLRRAYCRNGSPRTTACRLSNSSIPTRSLACQPAAGVFCWYEDLCVQA
jgi:hypothetical protein